jgi:hypothetical protein
MRAAQRSSRIAARATARLRMGSGGSGWSSVISYLTKSVRTEKGGSRGSCVPGVLAFETTLDRRCRWDFARIFLIFSSDGYVSGRATGSVDLRVDWIVGTTLPYALRRVGHPVWWWCGVWWSPMSRDRDMGHPAGWSSLLHRIGNAGFMNDAVTVIEV